MKSTLSILLISSFFLTGCYSQMYYTDTTYRRDVEWHADTLSKADSTYVEGYEDGYDDALDKFHYKNYAVADWYARHGFGMWYSDYYGFRYNHFNPYHYWYSPYPFSSISFYYGRPWYGFYSYYAPFGSGYWVCWDPWDDPYLYWPGHYYHYPAIAISVGYLHYPKSRRVTDGRYGRRTIGTSRVAVTREPVNRTENITRDRRISEPKTTVIRSPRTSTVRSRGTQVRTSRGTTIRSRSSGNSSRGRSTGRSSSRGRSRGN